MYQVYEAKRLKKSDNLMIQLESLLGKNSPKRLEDTNIINSFINGFKCLNYGGKHLSESESIKLFLQNWAKENKLIIIETSCTLIIFCASIGYQSSSFSTGIYNFVNNSITGFQDTIENGLDLESLNPGFYFANRQSENISGPDSEKDNDDTVAIKTNSIETVSIQALDDYMAEQNRVKEEKMYIQLYSDIFGLDYEKVYQILSNLTEDFQNEAYLKNYIIGNSTLKNRMVSCNSKEMAILIAVRNIYWCPENYGYGNNDLKTGIEFISDLEYSKQIAYVSNVLGVDPVLNYAICQAESSFKSPLFKNKNNPAGLKFSRTFTAFPSITAGFIEEALELLKYQIDGRTTIEAIGAKHAPTSDETNDSWVSNVTSIYKSSIKKYETLFGGEITLHKENPTISVTTENNEAQEKIYVYNSKYN